MEMYLNLSDFIDSYFLDGLIYSFFFQISLKIIIKKRIILKYLDVNPCFFKILRNALKEPECFFLYSVVVF